MKTTLFKTKELAEKYIRENYTLPMLEDAEISEEDNYDSDMPNLQWQGSCAAYNVIDPASGEIAECVAWWEVGDDRYELYIGGRLVSDYNNSYDAREAYDDAMETERYEDEPQEVKLFCNGEDASY